MVGDVLRYITICFFPDMLQFLEDVDENILTKELQPVYFTTVPELLGRIKQLFPDSHSYKQHKEDLDDDDSLFDEEDDSDEGNDRRISSLVDEGAEKKD